MSGFGYDDAARERRVTEAGKRAGAEVAVEERCATLCTASCTTGDLRV